VAVKTNTPSLASMVLPTSAEANEPVPSANDSGIVYSIYVISGTANNKHFCAVSVKC
jgi:hypothetical protein